MNFLVDAHQGLGDCVQLLPMLYNIRENYADANLTLIISSNAVKTIFELSNIKVDKYIYFERPSNNILKFLNFVIQMRKCHADYMVYCIQTPEKSAKLLSFMAGAGHDLGIQFQPSLKDIYKGKNRVELILGIIKPICKQVKVSFPKIFFNLSNYDLHENIKLDKQKINIAFCIGHGGPSFFKKDGKKIEVHTKGLPHLTQIELIRNLLALGYVVNLMGGEYEKKNFLHLYNEFLTNSQVNNFVGETSLIESIAIVQQCQLVFSCDTGMMHIAAALGKKTVSVFGPTDPAVQGAYSDKAKFIYGHEPCEPCFGTENYIKCANRKCLNNISVAEMYDMIKKVIEEKPI